MLYVEPPKDFSSSFTTTSCFLKHSGQFLVLQRHPDKDYGTYWGLPAGKVHRSETIEQATIREIAEETGIVISQPDLRLELSTYVRYPEYDFHFYAFRVELTERPVVQLSPTEHTNWLWITPQELRELKYLPDFDAITDQTYR